MVLANVLGGSSYVATGYALRGFSPEGLVFWRTLLGFFFFLPLIYKAVLRLELAWRDWARMMVVAVLGYAAPLLIGTVGQKLSSASNASLLVGVEPVTLVFLSALFLGETINSLKVAALLSGLAGSTLIILQGVPFWNATITPHFKGDVLLFLHGFCWALYSLIGKPLLRKVDAMTFAGLTTALSLLPMALCGGIAWPAGAGGSAVAAAAYLAAAVTFLGTWAWNKALEVMPASTVANFIFLQPLVGVGMAVLIQKEGFSPWSVAGGALILLGVYGTTMESRNQLAAGQGPTSYRPWALLGVYFWGPKK